MKRIVLPLSSLVLLLAAALSAGAQATTTVAPAYNLKAPFAAKPALLTSVGQSADIEMVKVLLTRAKLEFKLDSLVKAPALASSGAKTLVVVIGGSSKGLGAAGVSAEAELDRSKALIAEARKLGMKVIGVHVGGEARRGELSDRFVSAVVPSCDYIVVVAEGNQDGLFTKLCANAKIVLDSVDKIAKAGDPIARAFK